MRPIRDDEWVDVPDKPGWRQPKEELEMVESDLVKEFMIKRYNE